MSVSSVDRPVSALRQRMLDDMAMRGLRSDTQRDYIRVVRSFAAFLGRSPDTAQAEDIRQSQVHCQCRLNFPQTCRLKIPHFVAH
jgi:integrase/recombinase XerD